VNEKILSQKQMTKLPAETSLQQEGKTTEKLTLPDLQ